MEKRIEEIWQGWTVVKKLGTGGFGAVYEIKREIFGKTESAALKVISIPKENDEIEELYNEGYNEESIAVHYKSFLENIVNEYSIMLDMKGHTNIVYCDDLKYVEHKDGIGWDIYIKMELLTPLTKFALDSFSETEIIKLGVDICRALAVCKSQNVVHRDIKPQNIFVSRSGDYKLGDFGIAKISEKTQNGTAIGTLGYMPPEVGLGKPYGATADIYSLGLVLYWLLNNKKLPFLPTAAQVPTAEQKSEANLRRMSGEALPEPINGSEELKKIVLKACEYKPENRYATATEMMKALSKLLPDDDLAAVPIAAESENNINDDKTVALFDVSVQPEISKKTEELNSAEPENENAPITEVSEPEPENEKESVPAPESVSNIPLDETVAFFAEPVKETEDENEDEAETETEGSETTEVLKKAEPEPKPEKENKVDYKAFIEDKKLPEKEENKNKKGLIAIIGVVAVVAIVILILLLRSCGEDAPIGDNGNSDSGSKVVSEAVSETGTETETETELSETEHKSEDESSTVISEAVLETETELSETEHESEDESSNVISEAVSETETVSETENNCEDGHVYENGICIYCEDLQTKGLQYKLLDDGTYKVSGIGNCTDNEICFPSKYNGKAVTNIGNNAFRNCTSLTSVTIPASVTNIGNFAFSGCTSLTSVTIPSSVANIGLGVFNGCTSLTSVTIPSSVTNIGNVAFNGCTSLTSVTIPSSVTDIGGEAFRHCTSLTSVTIPDSVTDIGSNAFSGCTSLTSVTISDSVTNIGDFAFSGCTSLTSIEIPDSVTSIKKYAFSGCTSLTSVTIPDSVISIGEHAFMNCTSLTSVTISSSVTNIETCAFEGCDSLKNVIFEDTAGWYIEDTNGNLIAIAIDVSDPADAAVYLTEYYVENVFKKRT